MIVTLISFLVSFLITILTTPPTIKFANRFKLIDDPKLRPHPGRVLHRIVPRAGGLPVFLGLLISILIFIPLDKHIIGIIIGIIILLIVGLLDDLFTNFSPYPRLLLQIFVAAVVVVSGIGISFITNPLGGLLRFDQVIFQINILGPHKIILFADIFAFFWIVWMMNMINWSKGIDGQMPGIITVAGITIGILSYKLYFMGDINQLPVSILAFITSGAALGLFIFNWYPAKIFPGFSGSTILGFMIAVLSILSGAKLATALLVLLIPSIDFIYTFFKRIFSRHSPFFGGQDHVYYLLLKRGWSFRKISCVYIISCAILGLLSTTLSSQGKIFTLIGGIIIIVGGILWLHFFGQSLGQSDPDNG